jgi:hypothetical protein
MTGPTTPRPDERPGLTPDRNLEAAVRDTFPASDPLAPTVTQGARAVPPAHMMDEGGATPRQGMVALRQCFPDAEAAKLALEGLVRDGPLDRRSAEIREEGGAALLVVHVPPVDRARLEGLLQRAAGDPVPEGGAARA